MQALYAMGSQRRVDEFKLNARMHGATFDDDDTPSQTPAAAEAKIPLFGDPDAYEGVSESERNEMTQKMLQKHKSWAASDFVEGHG